jgi:hypothetical protein
VTEEAEGVVEVAEGETKDAPKVEEPEEPPTKTLEEFQAEKASKMVKVEKKARASRNEGFQGKAVSVKAGPANNGEVEEKKSVTNKARKAISIDEFSPAPARREYQDRGEGRGRGRGRGEGRGRGRGRGQGRGRGPRVLQLKDDSNFPKVGQ